MVYVSLVFLVFFFSSRRRHTRLQGDWSSDVCSSDLDDYTFSRGLEHDRLGVQGLAVAEQVVHELGEAALVEERLLLLLPLALVLERDREGLVQERELAQPGGDRGVVEARLGEDLRVGLEPDGRACALRLANDLQLLRGFAPLERHVVPLPVAVHPRSEEHTSELQSPCNLVCRLLLEKTN